MFRHIERDIVQRLLSSIEKAQVPGHYLLRLLCDLIVRTTGRIDAMRRRNLYRCPIGLVSWAVHLIVSNRSIRSHRWHASFLFQNGG